MPNWQPNWSDVTFDYQAAYSAIANCYGCVACMESRAHGIVPVRAQAVREWRGRYRAEFDVESSRLDRIGVDVVAQLHAAAHGIQLEIEAAEAEQRFRVAERGRWEAEVRAEHAREEQEALAARSSNRGTGAAGPNDTPRAPGVIVLS